MNWNTEQLRMLRAMGHEVLVRAGAADASPAAVMSGADAAPSEPSPPATVAPSSLAALQQALRRAAGDHDVSGLVGDLERLRRDPLLKRALWPRLRALRRSH